MITSQYEKERRLLERGAGERCQTLVEEHQRGKGYRCANAAETVCRDQQGRCSTSRQYRDRGARVMWDRRASSWAQLSSFSANLRCWRETMCCNELIHENPVMEMRRDQPRQSLRTCPGSSRSTPASDRASVWAGRPARSPSSAASPAASAPPSHRPYRVSDAWPC